MCNSRGMGSNRKLLAIADRAVDSSTLGALHAQRSASMDDADSGFGSRRSTTETHPDDDNDDEEDADDDDDDERPRTDPLELASLFSEEPRKLTKGFRRRQRRNRAKQRVSPSYLLFPYYCIYTYESNIVLWKTWASATHLVVISSSCNLCSVC